MKPFALLFVSFVFFSGLVRQTRQSSPCVCTTVDCPEEGTNHVVMGNGSAILDYIYSSHEEHEVVISAQGTITPESLDHGSGTTSCTQKYSRMLEDDGDQDCDAGHILAHRLGGYGNLPVNIFPQNAGVNRGVFAQFEGYIYDYLNGGNAKEATLHWDFLYTSNTHTMPFLVNYSAVFDDGYTLQSVFSNE
jgi:hypothetical protein